MTAARGQYGGRKVREGTVVSDKMEKTVLVAVEAHFRHRLYKKTVRRVRRFMAHDEREEAALGDRVRIIEATPISKNKRWRVVEVLNRAELPDVAAESIDLDLLGEVKREDEARDAAETPQATVSIEATNDSAEPSEVEAVDEIVEPSQDDLAEGSDAAEESDGETITSEVEKTESSESAGEEIVVEAVGDDVSEPEERPADDGDKGESA